MDICPKFMFCNTPAERQITASQRLIPLKSPWLGMEKSLHLHAQVRSTIVAPSHAKCGFGGTACDRHRETRGQINFIRHSYTTNLSRHHHPLNLKRERLSHQFSCLNSASIKDTELPVGVRVPEKTYRGSTLANSFSQSLVVRSSEFQPVACIMSRLLRNSQSCVY